MNNIPQEQNKQPRLDLLAAQRQLYSDAKFLQNNSIIIVFIAVIVGSILVASFSQLAVYAALWGITATLLDLLFITPSQKSIQQQAAQIQQDFDCQVLNFDWANLHCGFRVEPELIIEASDKYKLKDPSCSALKDWYPISIEKLPIHQARIICQRSNISWDAKLRRRYSNWIVRVLVTLTVIVFLIGLIGGLTVTKFVLAIIMPLLPVFVLGLRQHGEHKQAADRLHRLREDADTIVYETINGKLTPQDIERKSYSLQAHIYDHRRRNPSVFDWLYNRMKTKDEQLMNKVAEDLVQQFIQKP